MCLFDLGYLIAGPASLNKEGDSCKDIKMSGELELEIGRPLGAKTALRPPCSLWDSTVRHNKHDSIDKTFKSTVCHFLINLDKLTLNVDFLICRMGIITTSKGYSED